MSQFLIPPPFKMNMTGDLVSNWEFFRDGCQNDATATKLADNDENTVAAAIFLFVSSDAIFTTLRKNFNSQQIFVY